MTPLNTPVSAIADVLALWGLDGWLTPPLHTVVAGGSVVSGRALTVQVAAGEHGPGFAGIYDVLSGDLADRVIVLAGARDVPGAVFGEILAGAAHRRGAVGVLVDGWVRDRAAMQTIGMPVLAAGERVVGPNGLAHMVEVGGTVHVDGVAVAAGDTIVIDDSGCVRLPAHMADQVADAANRYAAAESLVGVAIANGEPLSTAYRHKKTVVAELTGSNPGTRR